MAMITGVTCAGYSLRQSYFRLTGHRANPGECAAAGVPYVEPLLA